MMKKTITLLLILLIGALQYAKADEGMWIPLLLEKYTIKDMQAKGFKLTAEDIYSVNKASMKDAVMIFGGGCTAELISDKGLILTNHHCGYGVIQSHSSVENDYLTDGFWAMSREDELVNPNLTVTFLVRMEDVTEKALKGVTDDMTMNKLKNTIETNILKIEQEAVADTHYEAKVKSFYYGNEFYLFITETFKDVRFVGAPPSSIGKFGGDTDNWVWPRHTGDFSLFRIYADKNNQPAEYSENNVPYKPKKHFPISLKGVKEGDFSMVFGYPGRTSEYLTSYAIDMVMNYQNPHRIRIRQNKIDVLNTAMNSDRKIRIQYSAKYARISNAWKKWIGQNKGLKKMNAIEKKQKFEADFTIWVNADAKRKEKYGKLLPTYEKLYEELIPYELALDYFYEAGYSLDISSIARIFNNLLPLTESATEEEIQKSVESVKKSLKNFYKDYHKPTDKKIFREMIELYATQIDTAYQPSFLRQAVFETDGNFDAIADWFYDTSFMVDEEKAMNFVDNYTPSQVDSISGDPVYLFYSGVIQVYRNIQPESDRITTTLDSLHRIWMNAIREMQPDKNFYPDANSTLRVSYGPVAGFEPTDAVIYEYYTTLDGVIAKDDPEIYDYNVPEKLKELHKKKDYGMYDEDGELHVCFTAANHTTGGNSGSPVINAEGHLIGVNFDRAWESTMSDYMYDINQCRNIALDIRYALFIIDKFAGATHLVEEMTIIK